MRQSRREGINIGIEGRKLHTPRSQTQFRRRKSIDEHRTQGRPSETLENYVQPTTILKKDGEATTPKGNNTGTQEVKTKTMLGIGYRGTSNIPVKKGLEINGLMSEFVEKTSFSGNWDEDVDNTINDFNTLANICEVNESEKLTALLVMLSGLQLLRFKYTKM